MKKKARRLIALLTAAFITVAGAATSWAADGNVVTISSSEQLINAIKNQKEGQVWELQPGNYDIGNAGVEIAVDGHGTGFVFPIVVNDLTIRGVGDGEVLVTSSYQATTGNWYEQNFITVFGSEVTIENVNLQGNPNSYYDDMCNKVVEVMAPNFTLKNVELLPLPSADGKQWSGSVFFSAEDAGNSVMENVTMYSWANARAVTQGTVTVNNVVQDFTGNVYAGEADYGFSISGDKVEIDGLTVKVDSSVNLTEQVVKKLQPGTTVELIEDVKVDEEVYILTDDVTIKGNGHTITASASFAKNLEGQDNLVKIEADNVTLDNVKLVSTNLTKHTLDIWGAGGVVLSDVTLDHENAYSGAPLIVNSSSVTVKNVFDMITGLNSWYGVNVDESNGDASITFDDSVSVSFTDNSDKDLPLLYLENLNGNSTDVVVNPENAGLILGDNGQFVEHTHNYKWDNDAFYHWQVCDCGSKTAEKLHEFGEWKVTKEATATEDGSKEKTCSVCGYVRKDVIPAGTSSEGEGNADNPNTGSNAGVSVAVALLCVSAVSAVAVGSKRKKG